MKYEKTIRDILKRLEKEIPLVEENDLFECMKTVFPNADKPREEKNIVLEGLEITPPLASSKEWKKMMEKDKAVLCQIYLEKDRGDILKVKEIKGNKVVVENLSIEEEFRTSFEIDKIEIAKKNYNLIKRKSVDLLKSLQKIGEI